jgi:hypothetical protein
MVSLVSTNSVTLILIHEFLIGTVDLENVGTSKTINVYIKTLEEKTIQCSISPSAEVGDLKDMIHSKENIPIDQQRLIFQGKQLEDGSTLEDCNIEHDSTLHVVLRLRGRGELVLPPSLLDEPSFLIGTVNLKKSVGTSKKIKVFIKTFSGELICSISPSAKVEDLKGMIQDQRNIPIDRQRLIFAGKQLDDVRTLEDYNIKDESIVHVVLRLKGGGELVLPASLLDETFHKDFTNISDNGVKFCRGGSIYIRPCGWQRYALKVKGKYPDDIWLNGKTPRDDQFSSAEEEWTVSYHGTSYHNGLSIAEEGFKLSQGTRFLYGKGIYSTPDIEVASLYAEEATVNGKIYKVVMQNRVNPKNVKKVGKDVTDVGEYWISPNDDDIRPYGFCVREIDGDSSKFAFLPNLCILQ